MVAAGIGSVDGVYEWSEAENLEAVKMCLDLGIDPNNVDQDGRTALHGAAHKGRNEVVRLWSSMALNWTPGTTAAATPSPEPCKVTDGCQSIIPGAWCAWASSPPSLARRRKRF